MTNIKVKAMVILPSADRRSHAVASLSPTAENPEGYDRLIGGHIELGETAREALDREVAEELGTELGEAQLLDVLESIYRINGNLGHEIVFVYAGRLREPTVIAADGGMFEDDGDPMPVRWRPVYDFAETHPLYPSGSSDLARAAVSG